MNRLLSLYLGSFANIQRNVWILSIAMFINRSGSMVLLFTSLYLTKDLHFTIAEAGLTLSFYGIGSVLGSYAGGWLTDRKNFFDIMFFSLIISGLILLLLLVTTTPLYISIIIFLYAFAADTFRPANSKAVAVYSTAQNLTRSVSSFTLGKYIHNIIAAKKPEQASITNKYLYPQYKAINPPIAGPIENPKLIAKRTNETERVRF